VLVADILAAGEFMKPPQPFGDLATCIPHALYAEPSGQRVRSLLQFFVQRGTGNHAQDDLLLRNEKRIWETIDQTGTCELPYLL